MKTKIWHIQFGNWTSLDVVAPNFKCAVQKARKIRKGEFMNRIQDITEVKLIAAED